MRLLQPWRKSALEQMKLKKPLKEKLKKYFIYRRMKKDGIKAKAPCDLKELQRDQSRLNQLRREAGLPRINYIVLMHDALSAGAKEIDF